MKTENSEKVHCPSFNLSEYLAFLSCCAPVPALLTPTTSFSNMSPPRPMLIHLHFTLPKRHPTEIEWPGARGPIETVNSDGLVAPSPLSSSMTFPSSMISSGPVPVRTCF